MHINLLYILLQLGTLNCVAFVAHYSIWHMSNSCWLIHLLDYDFTKVIGIHSQGVMTFDWHVNMARILQITEWRECKTANQGSCRSPSNQTRGGRHHHPIPTSKVISHKGGVDARHSPVHPEQRCSLVRMVLHLCIPLCTCTTSGACNWFWHAQILKLIAHHRYEIDCLWARVYLLCANVLYI